MCDYGKIIIFYLKNRSFQRRDTVIHSIDDWNTDLRRFNFSIPRLPYFHDLAPCDYFLFAK